MPVRGLILAELARPLMPAGPDPCPGMTAQEESGLGLKAEVDL